MDPANLKAQFQPQPEEPRLLSFPHLPDDAKYEDGTPILNKYSSTLTRGQWALLLSGGREILASESMNIHDVNCTLTTLKQPL
jgi:hypothetical protein